MICLLLILSAEISLTASVHSSTAVSATSETNFAKKGAACSDSPREAPPMRTRRREESGTKSRRVGVGIDDDKGWLTPCCESTPPAPDEFDNAFAGAATVHRHQGADRGAGEAAGPPLIWAKVVNSSVMAVLSFPVCASDRPSRKSGQQDAR